MAQVLTIVDERGRLLKAKERDKFVKPGKVIVPNVLWYAHALKVPASRRRSRPPSETLSEALERVGQLKAAEHGWNVIPFDTEMPVHMFKPTACLGGWWYDVQTGTLTQATPAPAFPWAWLVWPFSVPKPFNPETLTRWIPGIVFRWPAKDAIRPGTPQELSWRAWKREEQLRARKTYIAAYAHFFEKHHPIPGQTMKDLVEKVCAAFSVKVDDVVDYWGNSLVRTR